MKLQPSTLWARRSALAGAVVWLILFLIPLGDSAETSLIQRLVLLGTLVVVPLALSLAPGAEERDQQIFFYRLAVVTQPIGAAASVISFMVESGALAAALAAFWLCVNLIIFLWGITRVLRVELRTPEEISISAGLLYLPVAGFWLMVSRLGVQLAGFGDTIILLTAIHFHFAAYAAPILAGLAGRNLRTQVGGNQAAFPLVPLGIIGGVPFVAAGITFSPELAMFGALLMAAGLLLLSVLVIAFVAPRVSPVISRVLLCISAVSSAIAIIMACIYAYSIAAHKLILDIPQMAKTHGLINAFGFVLCGLIAWSVVDSKSGSVLNR